MTFSNFKTQGNPCGCCGGCTIFADAFSVDDIATQWNVRSGSFSISGGTLNTSSNGIIRCETAMSAGATGAHVIVTMNFTNNETGKLLLGYTDDNNYWYITLTANWDGTSGNGQLKLWQRSGGVDTQRGSTKTVNSLAGGDSALVCFSIGDGVARVNVSSATAGAAFIEFTTSASMASTKAGLGALMGTSMSFDDFELKTHYVDDHKCGTCIGACEGLCIDTAVPGQVQVTLTGVVNGPNSVGDPCTSQNCGLVNTTHTLTYSPDNCYWSVAGPLACSNYPTNSFQLFVKPKSIGAAYIGGYSHSNNYSGGVFSGSPYACAYEVAETYPTDCTASHANIPCTFGCGTDPFAPNICDQSAAEATIIPL